MESIPWEIFGEKADLIDLSTRSKLWYATPEKRVDKTLRRKLPRRKWDGDRKLCV